jgi:4-amino-4-deoxy-L-arabinose transferase-like glycosyltransferase
MFRLDPRLEARLVWGAAAAFVLLAAAAAVRSSLTFDEQAYVPAGHVQWLTGRILFDLEHPPLAKWIVGFLPWLLGAPLEPERLAGFATLDQWTFGASYFARPEQNLETTLLLARCPVILLGGALVLVTASLARRLSGPRAAVSAAFLCVACPPLVAHFALATTDGAVTFFSALGAERAVAFARTPTRRALAGLGLALGAALATKHMAAAFVLGLVAGAAGWVLEAEREARPGRLRAALVALAAVCTLALVALAATYPNLAGIANYPRDLRVMSDNYQSYLHGGFSVHGFASYFVVALGLKLPLPLVGLALAGVVLAIARRRDGAAWFGLGVALVAVLVIVTWKAFDLGVRLVLPALPLLVVFAASAAAWLSERGAASVALLAALGVWSVVGMVQAGTRPLSWFNEIAGGREHGAEWLDDSNVDWGDGLIELREWLAREPRAEVFVTHVPWYPPSFYVPGARWVTLERLAEDLAAERKPGLYVVSQTLRNRLPLVPSLAAAKLYVRPPDAHVGPFLVYRVGAP